MPHIDRVNSGFAVPGRSAPLRASTAILMNVRVAAASRRLRKRIMGVPRVTGRACLAVSGAGLRVPGHEAGHRGDTTQIGAEKARMLPLRWSDGARCRQ